MIAALIACIVLSGCSGPGGDAAEIARPSGDAPQVIEYDLGVVTPGTKMTHKFLIENHDLIRWTYRKFETDCSCTVTSATSKWIEPGGSDLVEVAYSVPTAHVDDRRRVKVLFKEPAAPLKELVLRASVRKPVEVLPERLAFRKARSGGVYSEFFEITNYQASPLRIRSIKASDERLKTRLISVPQPEGVASVPRESWRVDVEARADNLAPGPHQYTIEVETDAPDNSKFSVGVDLTIRSAVEAIPSRLFYGTIKAGQAASNRILLHFADGRPVETPAEIGMSHDLGDRLRFEWTPRSAEFWELQVFLTPHPDDQYLEGMLALDLHDRNVPILNLPITSRVEP